MGLSYLKDSVFLKKLDLENLKKCYVKIIILTADELPIKAIEGRISNGSINIDGSSAIRRTCNLTFLAEETENDLTNIDNLLSMNKKIKIEIGIENSIDDRYDDIIWFKQGIFVINQPNISHSNSGVTISLSCKDKMCLLNGECGGGLPASVVFSSYDQINEDGSVTSIENRIFDIIQTLVINYGGENINKVFINDVPLEIKQIVRWTGAEDLFFNPATGIYTLNADTVAEEGGVWRTFKYNEDIGYSYVNFTYPGELVSSIGENVCSVLEKIKSALGNYEYFYDVDGNFVFQEIKNYLNNSYQATKKYKLGTEESRIEYNNLNILSNDDYYVDYNGEPKSIYNFDEGNGLISSYSNAPSYTNIKNDFHIWGKNNDGYAIHYHLAIKEKPGIYGPHKVIFLQDEQGNYTGKLKLAPEDSEDSMEYIAEDWRAELYLQGLEKKNLGQRPDIYEQELLDLFDAIYDFKEKKFKVDIIHYPNDLTYFIDFLEPVGELADCSVNSLKQSKIYSYQQDGINKLYESDIPNIILVNISADAAEREHIIDRCEIEGQSFSNVNNNIYSKIAFNTTGYAAHTTARELLYQYTDYNSSINIQSIPIYYLDVNRRVTINDKASNIYGDYIIKSISLPLDAKSTMTISAVRALERI